MGAGRRRRAPRPPSEAATGAVREPPGRTAIPGGERKYRESPRPPADNPGEMGAPRPGWTGLN